MKFGSSDEKFDVWPWPFSTTIEIVTKFLLLNRSLASRLNNNIKPLEKATNIVFLYCRTSVSTAATLDGESILTRLISHTYFSDHAICVLF